MRAAVIDVLAFLQLRRDSATIVGTLEQTSEREGVLPVFRLIPPSEYVLNLVKECAGIEWLVSAFVLDALPNEISQVKPVLQDRLEIRTSKTKPEFIQIPPCAA